MKLKKILALVLCGAITVGLLGGCSGSEDKKEEDGSKKKQKVVMWRKKSKDRGEKRKFISAAF